MELIAIEILELAGEDKLGKKRKRVTVNNGIILFIICRFPQ